MAKQFAAQAIGINGMSFDGVVTTRKAQDTQLQALLDHCVASNALAARSQTVGARTWAYYRVDVANRRLVQVVKAEAEALAALF